MTQPYTLNRLRLLDWLHENVDAGRKNRGIAYVREGRISLRGTANPIRAQVQGSRTYSVEVWIGPNGEPAETNCTCPDGDIHECKHVAGVVWLAAMEFQTGLPSIENEPPRRPKQRAPKLDPRTRSWLRDVQHAETVNTAAAPHETDTVYSIEFLPDSIFVRDTTAPLRQDDEHLFDDSAFEDDDFPYDDFPLDEEEGEEYPNPWDMADDGPQLRGRLAPWQQPFPNGHHQAIRLREPAAGVLFRTGLQRSKIVFADTGEPVVLDPAPLECRITSRIEGDAVVLEAVLFDGMQVIAATEHSRTGPSQAWARTGASVRPVAPSAPAILDALQMPVRLPTPVFLEQRELLMQRLGPLLLHPLPDLNVMPIRLTRSLPLVLIREEGGMLSVQLRVRCESVDLPVPLEWDPFTGNAAETAIVYAGGQWIGFSRPKSAEKKLRAIGTKGSQTLRDERAFEFLLTLDALEQQLGLVVEGRETLRTFRIRPGELDAQLEVTASGATFSAALAMRLEGQTVDANAVLRAWLNGRKFVSTPEGAVRLGDSLPKNLRDLTQRMGSSAGEWSISRAETLGLASDPAWGSRMSGIGDTKALVEKARTFTGLTEVLPSVRFQTQLRPYQAKGLAWLSFLRDFQVGGILADDMGLGKTVQSAALLDLVHGEQPPLSPLPSLVLAPASVAINWEQELRRFCPHLRIAVPRTVAEARLIEFGMVQVVILSYQMAVLMGDALSKQPFELCFLDEAQALKNPRAIRTEFVRHQIQARVRIALTGTPLENHLGELRSIMDIVSPGLLGSESDFARRFRIPIEKQRNTAALASLRRMVGPLMLRRNKTEVAIDLPPKNDTTVWCEMEADQKKIYAGLLAAYQLSITQKIREVGFARSKIFILEALLRLRQAACHTGLLPSNLRQGKLVSAKFELLEELLGEALGGDSKVLVFSQFVELLALLRKKKPDDRPFAYLDGATPRAKRESEIKRFQTNPRCRLFLLSLHAGGRGINLTAADVVIHLDLWWNPAVEDQATDRAHRIGQTRPVMAYRIVTRGTVEETILQMQTKKRALFRSMMDGDEVKVAESLSREDVAALFQLDAGALAST